MKHVIIVVAMLAMVGCGQTQIGHQLGQTSAQASQQQYVRVPITAVTPEFIAATGFERDHVSSESYAFGYVTADNLTTAQQWTTLDQLDEALLARHAFDPETLALLAMPAGAEVFEDYHDYDALTTELQRLADVYPDRIAIASAGQSVDGRELWYARISDQIDEDEAEPKLLYIANMHGDETAGRELMIYLIRQLVETYDENPRIKNLVDHSEIFIMPSMNPDGFERARRANNRNSDLNRNFPDFTSRPDDNPAGKQVETQAVMALHDDHHFVIALNYHGGAVCFNMPWDTQSNGSAATRFGDDPLMRVLAREYADANETMRNGRWDRGVTYGYEWYEVNGGMQDWASHYRQSVHATIELSNTKYPDARYLPGIWQDNQESILRYLERGLEGIHLMVTDEAGNAIPEVSVEVASLNRAISYENGEVYRVTLPGEQTVTVTAAGFEPLVLNLTAAPYRGNLTQVSLNPSATR